MTSSPRDGVGAARRAAEVAGAASPVVALVASAGGLGALTSVLKAFSADFTFSVVIAQHLGGHGSYLVDILRRRVPLRVEWAADGASLAQGTVVVCPPRTRVELLPDGTLSLSPVSGPGAGGMLDALLRSLADAVGARAVAVVLTGMGRDGLAGARAVKHAGGTVIAQSEKSAEHASMPLAVAEAGVADLVLDLMDIGSVLWDVAHGGSLPRPPGESPSAQAVFAGTTEVAALLRDVEWGRTPLGPVEQWPAQLVTLLRTILDSPVGMCLLWGPDFLQFYNDAYRVLMGAKHPDGLGQANRDCWPEVWHLNEPVYTRVMAGEAVSFKDALYPVTRSGEREDAWFDLTFSPVRGDGATPVGVLSTVIETTVEVLNRRRLNLLNALAACARNAAGRRAAMASFVAALADGVQDIPFAIGYLVHQAHSRLELVAAEGTEPGGPLAPHIAPMSQRKPNWPIADLVTTGQPVLVTDLAQTYRGVSVGGRGAGDGEEPDRAMLFPLGAADARTPAGVLILGMNPRLPLTDEYRDFLGLVAVQATAALVDAASRQRQDTRIDRLADLDRVKTEFLSNVSHELRTPLTLLLAPLDDLAAPHAGVPPDLRGHVDVAGRNARRLLTMVETLLDFSQIEAGRLRARFEPTDLARLTTDIAGTFRGATDRAGIALRVDCPELDEPVLVDPAMWEKIVANLLANAVKFTFTGTITVELRELRAHVELVVRDTGVGIPADELPHVFTRFHRGRTTRSRTHDGAGIGLALVNELARLLHGRARAQSTVGEGSEFTVWIPREQPHGVDTAGARGDRRPVAAVLAEIAAHWDSGTDQAQAMTRPAQARLLVADDNQDMRSYLIRLLSPLWHVRAVGDGAQALEWARREPPDLVVADVMMPTIDGVELARRLRADAALHDVPLVMLSARADEESVVEGLNAGADDYLVKPFAATELVARIAAQLERRRVREIGDRRFRALVNATFDVVYRMNPDWTEMRALDGRGFIADTTAPDRTWLDVYIAPQDQPRTLAAITEAARTTSVFELTHRVRRADGTFTWIHSRAIPLCDDDGEIIEWVGTAVEQPGPGSASPPAED